MNSLGTDGVLIWADSDLAPTPKFYFLTYKTRTRLLPQFLLQMSKKVTKVKEVKK